MSRPSPRNSSCACTSAVCEHGCLHAKDRRQRGRAREAVMTSATILVTNGSNMMPRRWYDALGGTVNLTAREAIGPYHIVSSLSRKSLVV